MSTNHNLIDLHACPVPGCGGYAERGRCAFGYFVKCAACGLRTEYYLRQCEATYDWQRKCEKLTARPPKKPAGKPRPPRPHGGQHHGGRRGGAVPGDE